MRAGHVGLAICLLLNAGTGAADSDPFMFRDQLASGGFGPELVLVEPGAFQMGTPSSEVGRDNDEGPQATVSFDSALYVGRTEITVAEFAQFVEQGGYQTDAELTGCYLWRQGKLEADRQASWTNLPGFASSEAHPVVCVSWRDAFRYAEWLSEETGFAYRLPTEAEWEFAARAGSGAARFWSDDSNQACIYANVSDQSMKRLYPDDERSFHECDDGYPQAAPVGRFTSNAFGLYDMLGNVWEWTCSVFDSLSSEGPSRCVDYWDPGQRVLRGGAWYLPPQAVRSGHRNAGTFGSQGVSIGFRVVREL